jgi:hypothetical protein
MTARRVVLTTVIVALACGLLPSVTHANDGCFSNAWMNAPAFGYSGSLYGLGYVPVPPYYALHPPVYYGDRYFRTYGESPFPRSDYSSRPQRIRVDVIVNPFYTAPAGAAVGKAEQTETPAEPTPAAAEQVTSQPQMIMNPFYHPEAKMARHER